jgi:hypothetical protein
MSDDILFVQLCVDIGILEYLKIFLCHTKEKIKLLKVTKILYAFIVDLFNNIKMLLSMF